LSHSWIKRNSRRFKNRWSAASKLEFGTNAVNAAATLYQVGYAVVTGLRKASGVGPTSLDRWFWLFAAALAYTTIYRFVPKDVFRRAKSLLEEQIRAQSYGAALTVIEEGIDKGSLERESLLWLEHCILRGVKSEVEQLLGECDGVYLDVLLLVPDPDDATKLHACASANTTQGINVRYLKAGSLSWEAMQTGRVRYDPDFQSSFGTSTVPRRSVLTIPIATADSPAPGAVKITSGRSHHFDDYEEQIAATLIPARRMLGVALTCRRRLLKEKPKHAGDS
jgi:hypothetical protein